MIYDYLNRI